MYKTLIAIFILSLFSLASCNSDKKEGSTVTDKTELKSMSDSEKAERREQKKKERANLSETEMEEMMNKKKEDRAKKKEAQKAERKKSDRKSGQKGDRSAGDRAAKRSGNRNSGFNEEYYTALQAALGLSDDQINTLKSLNDKRTTDASKASSREEKAEVNNSYKKGRAEAFGDELNMKMMTFDKEWRTGKK